MGKDISSDWFRYSLMLARKVDNVMQVGSQYGGGFGSLDIFAWIYVLHSFVVQGTIDK